MKKQILPLLLFLMSSVAMGQSSGNDYKMAVGFKFYPGAVSGKYFIQENRAVEGLLTFWNYGFRTTALYEIHGDISGAPGLKWYAGPGAHFGIWNDQWRSAYPNRASGASLGIDGVLGLDYKIKGAPLNISIDWQPSFNMIGYSYFESGWGGLGIRYVIK